VNRGMGPNQFVRRGNQFEVKLSEVLGVQTRVSSEWAWARVHSAHGCHCANVSGAAGVERDHSDATHRDHRASYHCASTSAASAVAVYNVTHV